MSGKWAVIKWKPAEDNSKVGVFEFESISGANALANELNIRARSSKSQDVYLSDWYDPNKKDPAGYVEQE